MSFDAQMFAESGDVDGAWAAYDAEGNLVDYTSGRVGRCTRRALHSNSVNLFIRFVSAITSCII